MCTYNRVAYLLAGLLFLELKKSVFRHFKKNGSSEIGLDSTGLVIDLHISETLTSLGWFFYKNDSLY
jgi:hypothetical protein